MVDRLSQSTRLIVACVISAAIIGLWDMFFMAPIRAEYEEEQRLAEKHVKEAVIPSEGEAGATKVYQPREVVTQGELAKGKRVELFNDKVQASVNLVGARLDDLTLKHYKDSLEPASKQVHLLSPSNTDQRYFFEFGWVNDSIDMTSLPTDKTLWSVDKNLSSPGEKVVLTWTNGERMQFVIEISLDNQYMFAVKQKVVNHADKKIAIRTYAAINRLSQKDNGNSVVHEGPIAVVGGKLQEFTIDDLNQEKEINLANSINWQGFSDKYWLTAVIPAKVEVDKAAFKSYEKFKEHRYQANLLSKPIIINPGAEHISETHVFAGAKELETLDYYEKNLNISLFDRALDFGFLYFITKPLFEFLHLIYNYIGNFGLAILILTVLIKVLLFPLAHKGFKGMNRLKDLQPKMTNLKEKYADNPAAFQQAMLELYRKEKVNPMGGCLPIVLQIPIFFALYKVLYVSIEMRHAPFYGWIHDLSAPDPTNLFTLFNLIPWDAPSFLNVGILPIFMALTMYWQQKLNPEPSDPTQAMVMKFLPWVFMFMFAAFPSGLIIYWAWSNILSIGQQLMIKKLEGKPAKR